MKRELIVVILLMVALATVGGSYLLQSRQPVEPAVQTYATQVTGSTSMGDVEIALTPRIASGRLVVDFAANTHSIRLSEYDLSEVVTLHYGGQTAKPVEAPSMSGHHVYGDMVFDVAPKTFTITIVDIPDVPERTYSWEG